LEFGSIGKGSRGNVKTSKVKGRAKTTQLQDELPEWYHRGRGEISKGKPAAAGARLGRPPRATRKFKIKTTGQSTPSENAALVSSTRVETNCKGHGCERLAHPPNRHPYAHFRLPSPSLLVSAMLPRRPIESSSTVVTGIRSNSKDDSESPFQKISASRSRHISTAATRTDGSLFC
jgi:hypothetical protein